MTVPSAGLPAPSCVWVESPLQAISAVEAHAHGLLAQETTVVPRRGVASLPGAIAGLRAMDLPTGLTFAPAVAKPPLWSFEGSWAIADPFSGVVQQRLLTGRVHRLLVLDDGLATVQFLSLITRDVPAALIRWDAFPARSRRVYAALASRAVNKIGARGGLTVWTAMPVDADLRSAAHRHGIRVQRNAFDWLRAQPTPPALPGHSVVLGNSLVATGAIHPGFYREWLDGVAGDGQISYLPHRREDETFLRDLAGDKRFTVHDVSVPAELSVRGVRPGQQVLGLTTSALVTLRRILAGRGVRVVEHVVPPSWWTAAASPALVAAYRNPAIQRPTHQPM